MKVLFVGEEGIISSKLERFLKTNSVLVELVTSILEGLELVKLYEYDAIVVREIENLMALKKFGTKIPVVMLPKLRSLVFTLECFRLGADEVLEAKIDKEEILARLKAVVRRSAGQIASEIKVGKMVVDLTNCRVLVEGKDIWLTRMEYRFLELLVLRKGKVVSKESMFQHLYNSDSETDVKVIDVFLTKIRKKVKNLTGDNYIETVWAQGWKIPDKLPAKELQVGAKNKRKRNFGVPSKLPMPNLVEQFSPTAFA